MPSIVIGGPRILALAGAELTELNPGLGALAGVDRPGVFVINVAVGTPAKESGLIAGDVIVKAGPLVVGDPGDLIRAFRESNGSTLRLEIIRKKKSADGYAALVTGLVEPTLLGHERVVNR